jgi:enoyl-CoA hydratase/carnithine racemase
MSEAEIAFEKIGCCGVITLSRPRALNVLSFDHAPRCRRLRA